MGCRDIGLRISEFGAKKSVSLLYAAQFWIKSYYPNQVPHFLGLDVFFCREAST